MNSLLRVPRRLEEQPETRDWFSADGVGVKMTHAKKGGTILPQHSHPYAHLSMIASGAVRVSCEGKHVGDFEAPAGIEIEAHKKHLFMTLEDDTVIYCIHNVSRHGGFDIEEEHQIVPVEQP